MRVERLTGKDGVEYRFFDCPGCAQNHCVPITGPKAWGYNGDDAKPTLNPSLLVRGTMPCTDEQLERIRKGEKVVPIPYCCHSYVREGRIQFLDDCTHSLKGQTVDLPEIKP